MRKPLKITISLFVTLLLDFFLLFIKDAGKTGSGLLTRLFSLAISAKIRIREITPQKTFYEFIKLLSNAIKKRVCLINLGAKFLAKVINSLVSGARI